MLCPDGIERVPHVCVQALAWQPMPDACMVQRQSAAAGHPSGHKLQLLMQVKGASCVTCRDCSFGCCTVLSMQPRVVAVPNPYAQAAKAARTCAANRSVLMLDLWVGTHGAQSVQMTVVCAVHQTQIFWLDPHAAVLPIESHHHVLCTLRARCNEHCNQDGWLNAL